jgi:hypothetical protein
VGEAEVSTTEAHDVGVGAEEDRSGAESKVGEGEAHGVTAICRRCSDCVRGDEAVPNGIEPPFSNDSCPERALGPDSDRLRTFGRNQHLQQSGRVTNASRDCKEGF